MNQYIKKMDKFTHLSDLCVTPSKCVNLITINRIEMTDRVV